MHPHEANDIQGFSINSVDLNFALLPGMIGFLLVQTSSLDAFFCFTPSSFHPLFILFDLIKSTLVVTSRTRQIHQLEKKNSAAFEHLIEKVKKLQGREHVRSSKRI